jgi:glycosyltransferase involved in cell wall biosynthesis
MRSGNNRPRVTVVTPVYNEADGLESYAAEVTEVLLDNPEIEFSVLLVDDGSNDGSWETIRRLCTGDPRFAGVRLSRNFGSHTALAAGFNHVGGETDAVATLAADLQDPPQTVLSFVEEWRSGAKIVWGKRANRRDSRWRIAASKLFHWLLRRYAMPKGSKFTTGSFFLMDRQVLEAVRQFNETNRITFALVAWTGFDQAEVPYERRKRTAGTSGWKFGAMIKAMYDAFISFSELPIRVMRWVAVISMLAAIGLFGYFLAVGILGTSAPGWASQMLLLSFFFGIQFWLLATIGEYLTRIHREAARRPLYFVSETAGGLGDASN